LITGRNAANKRQGLGCGSRKLEGGVARAQAIIRQEEGIWLLAARVAERCLKRLGQGYPNARTKNGARWNFPEAPIAVKESTD